MSTRKAHGVFALTGVVALLGLVSCRNFATSMKERVESPPDITPTTIDYVDSEGFDGLLESALVIQDPVIIIRTGHTQPDWTGRLNAWIAAWNRGGASATRKQPRAEREELPPSVVRAQSPAPKVTIDGDSIREFRLLVASLLDRVEELAQAGAGWWVEDRARARRVALLKPYSLRFHMDEDGQILLVFFHGNYASYYPRFLELLMKSGEPQDRKWTRAYECSACKLDKRAGIDHLTSRGTK